MYIRIQNEMNWPVYLTSFPKISRFSIERSNLSSLLPAYIIFIKVISYMMLLMKLAKYRLNNMIKWRQAVFSLALCVVQSIIKRLSIRTDIANMAVIIQNITKRIASMKKITLR